MAHWKSPVGDMVWTIFLNKAFIIIIIIIIIIISAEHLASPKPGTIKKVIWD